MVSMSRSPYSVSRMVFVACGDVGFGDWICEVDRGRPLGMSPVTARDSRREEDEFLLEELECLPEDDDLDDFDDELFEDLLDLSDGTSRIFNTRPVVGSVVEDVAGS